jgi:putative addiction module component (TIGR02574 family)
LESLGLDTLPLSPAQAAELDRRLETADADLDADVSWKTFRAERRNRPR